MWFFRLQYKYDASILDVTTNNDRTTLIPIVSTYYIFFPKAIVSTTSSRYVVLVPLVVELRTYFNHTTITTELRNFPLSVMTSSKILPTRPSFLRACRPPSVWRRHHQFTPIDWAKMGNASKAHHSSKDDNFFATNPPLFFYTEKFHL